MSPQHSCHDMCKNLKQSNSQYWSYSKTYSIDLGLRVKIICKMDPWTSSIIWPRETRLHKAPEQRSVTAEVHTTQDHATERKLADTRNIHFDWLHICRKPSVDNNNGKHVHDDVINWKHFFALLALFAGNSPVTGEFPPQRPVKRSFDVFCA